MRKQKPILYLDVDGVLLAFPDTNTACDLDAWYGRQRKGARFGVAAPGAKQFLEWVVQHFEVRWLTCWTMVGEMDEEDVQRLSPTLDVAPELLRSIYNSRPHNCSPKIGGIDFGTDRPWIWIEDEINELEEWTLYQLGVRDRFLYTNTSKDPFALLKTQVILAERFELPL